MNIENEIFKKSQVDYQHLLEYGFIKEKDHYILERNFLNNQFKAIISITNGKLVGKVIDLQTDEEYTNIRTEMNGEFVSQVRETYKDILIDIKDKCFITNSFISNQANRLARYMQDKYDSKPEFLWEKFPSYGVFRNKHNNKWYALIATIDKSKLLDDVGEITILNIKISPKEIPNLLKENGFFEAYHMSKKDWITITLDETLKDNQIIPLIDESFTLVDKK